MKECTLKLHNRKAYITGKEKTKGNVLYIQLRIPWNEEEDELFLNFHGYTRPANYTGLYGWYRKSDIKVI